MDAGGGLSTRQRKALADALAGVVASLVSLWTFYPIDVIKTNVQADSSSASTSSSAGMYRGVCVKTLHSASSSFCYFYIYSWILSWSTYRRKTARPSTLTRLALSAVAALLNTCLTLPLDVLSAKQQTQQESKTMDQVWEDVDDTCDDSEISVQDEKEDDTCAVTDQIATKVPSNADAKDWRGLWKGLWPSLLLCSNPSIHYTAFDVIKSRILQRQPGKHKLNMPEAFVVGLLAKFVATVATYPLIRTKIMLMVTSEKSMFRCLMQECKRNGFSGWYRGCRLQLFHTLLKSALLMMVRERISTSTHRLLVPISRDG